MAFLDNSGDIILDAVLTDTGRRRMANGNFSIIKFALGDDEIDYRLYNKNHPSGSAYYDLEILQSPVFESVTAQNSAINYGLLSITRRDLLYLPDIKLNTKINHCVLPKDRVLMFAVNSETVSKLLTSLGGGSADRHIGQTNISSTGGGAKIIYLETGLDTTELVANSVNRNTYLASTDLIDSTMIVQADNRFITQIRAGTETFSAGSTSTESVIPGFSSGVGSTASGLSTGLLNYSNFNISTVSNLLYAPTVDRVDYSMFTGPRGVFAYFNIYINESLRSISSAPRPEAYNRSGKTSQNIFSDGVLYDYIDTTINVIGTNSTVVSQLPLRLIRYASG